MEPLLRRACTSAVGEGRLGVITATGGSFVVGGGGEEEPEVSIRLVDRAAQIELMLNPALKLGELYMDGRLLMERGTIYDLLALLMRARPNGRGFVGEALATRLRAVLARLTRNHAARARSNVAHHYDLDRRLYDLFLDADRQYSCAYFEHAEQSLDAAQLAKKRHIAAKLLIEPQHGVLDIGCGWGGLALYLAGVAGARHVKGVTLSTEQHDLAVQRATAEGLASRIEIALEDYRQVEGRFDRIVSVGMFEHVGLAHYDAFFATCARLLEEDGVMLLHTIGATGEPGPTNPWITKYVFPGGHIPTLSEMMPAIERAGLRLTDVEVLRVHYAHTLNAWRARFMARRAEAAALYDERFCRMWEFYLASCEAAFRHEDLVVFQLQLARRNDVVPLTRDYVGERERMLRILEAGRIEPRARACG